MKQNTTTTLDPVTVTIDRLLKLPDVLAIVPVSETRWYEGIKAGIYPAQVRIGSRSVAWRASDIKKLVDGFGKNQPKSRASLGVVR
jgi:predicted DNA-binding transcriptional regulator AlpA